MLRFENRSEAGIQLAQKLTKYMHQNNAIVLGLARGGVVVAHAVAQALSLPLRVLVSKKIGSPNDPELAVGAVAEDGTVWLNESLISALDLSPAWLNEAKMQTQALAKQKLALYTHTQNLLNLEGKIAILVDDGIATGATFLAQILSLKKRGVAKIVAAVPIASKEAWQQVQRLCDEAISLIVIQEFEGISQFYNHFEQVEDQTVLSLLNSRRRLFFALDMQAPWPSQWPRGTLQKTRHATLAFLGLTDYCLLEPHLYQNNLKNRFSSQGDPPDLTPDRTPITEEQEAIENSSVETNPTHLNTDASNGFGIDPFPLPSFQIGPSGYFDKPLFLPKSSPHAAAWHIHWQNDAILAYQRQIVDWLSKHNLILYRNNQKNREFDKKAPPTFCSGETTIAEGQSASENKNFEELPTPSQTDSSDCFGIDQKEWLSHVTVARGVIDQQQWRKFFRPLPCYATAIHLYETVEHGTYRSLWSYPFKAPFEELEHTADLAYLIYGNNLSEIYHNAFLALSFKEPQLLLYKKANVLPSNLSDIIIALNRAIAELDRLTGSPFKAVSYHGEIQLIRHLCPNQLKNQKIGTASSGDVSICQWEMIVDI